MIELLISAGSLLAGLGAAISAALAWRSFRAAERLQSSYNAREKRTVWKEIRTLLAKAKAKKGDILRLSVDLAAAYRTLFAFAGQGGRSSRLDIYLNRVEEVKSLSLADWSNAEKAAAAHSALKEIDYDSAGDTLVRLEEYFIRLSLNHDQLQRELSDVERQNDQHRAQAIKPSPPQSPYGSIAPPRK